MSVKDHVEAAVSTAFEAFSLTDAKWAAVHMASAQVHATLALVEQQRIANIIALATYEVTGENPQPSFAEALLHGLDNVSSGNTVRGHFSSEIVKGLQI